MAKIPETTNPREMLADMSDDEILLHTITVAEGVKPACGMSLRTLRTRSGHSLRDAAKVIRRAFNTLSDWENCASYPQRGSTSYANLPLLLQSFGVSPKIIIKAFGDGQLDESLNPAEYLSRDALGIAELELAFMTSKRGAVVASLVKSAMSGSSRHQEIFFDRIGVLEREVVQRSSLSLAKRNRNNLEERGKWLKQSINDSSSVKPAQLEPKVADKPSSEDKASSSRETPSSSVPCEHDKDNVQPDNIPGV